MTPLWHILLPDGGTEGPYTEEDLLDLLAARELSPDAVCELRPGRRRGRVGELFQVIAPDPAEVSDADDFEEYEDAEDPQDEPPPKVAWQPAPFPDEAAAPAAPVRSGPRVCWAGNPSILLYARSVLVSVLFLAGGWYAGRWHGEWLAVGLISGSALGLLTVIRRSATHYIVTTRRVEVQRGILSKSSREVRIQDIRSINVTKTGLAGLLGIGTVEFASAGTEGEEVTFQRIWRAHAVKALVRKLQDRES